MAKAYKSREIEEILVDKFGFELDDDAAAHHRFYVLKLENLPLIRTKFSHTRKTDIGRKLESIIARQLHVRSKFFREMLDCTQDKEDYYLQVEDDPYPPFPDYLRLS